MTTTWQPTLVPIETQIRLARAQQLAARAAWARSPNAATIAATKLADRELDVLLDRLSAALRNRNVVT